MADPITHLFGQFEKLSKEFESLRNEKAEETNVLKRALEISVTDQCTFRRFIETYPKHPLVEELVAKNPESIESFFPNTLPYYVELLKLHVEQLERSSDALKLQVDDKQYKILNLENELRRLNGEVVRVNREAVDRAKAQIAEKGEMEVRSFQLKQQIEISDRLNAKCAELDGILQQRDAQIRDYETKLRELRPFYRFCHDFISNNERDFQANVLSEFKHHLSKVRVLGSAPSSDLPPEKRARRE